ncbi:hypothetical protein BH24ACT11_BH24ACT11_07100 [soil metagenome]
MKLTRAGVVTGALILTATTLAAAPAVANGGDAEDIVGTSGDDILLGGSGRDALWGQGGDDVLRAGSQAAEGMVFLRGGGGNDTSYGGKHGDHLVGGSGSDTFYARGGADTVYPDRGIDVVRLGKGNDTGLVVELDNKVDVFYCGPGNDSVVYYYDQIDPRDQHHGCESVEYAVD